METKRPPISPAFATNDAHADVERSISNFTKTVKELQEMHWSGSSSSVQALLMEAQEELHNLADRCSTPRSMKRSFPGEESLILDTVDMSNHGDTPLPFNEDTLRKEEEEDLALLRSIPLQSLLGACFEQECKKGSRPSSGQLSIASTMSSFNGQSAKVSSTPTSRLSHESQACDYASYPFTSPTPTLPCLRSVNGKEVFGDVHPELFETRSTCGSPRPTLDCLGDHPRMFQSMDADIEPLSRSRTNNGCTSRFSKSPLACLGKALKDVVPVNDILEEQECDDEDDDDDDAWELEFLRRAECD